MLAQREPDLQGIDPQAPDITGGISLWKGGAIGSAVLTLISAGPALARAFRSPRIAQGPILHLTSTMNSDAIISSAEQIMPAGQTATAGSAVDIIASNIDFQSRNLLDNLGARLIVSIPGLMQDVHQPTVELKGATSQDAMATYACPSPSSNSAIDNWQSIEVFPNGQATATPCLSKDIVTMSAVDPNNSKYAAAYARYKADPLRSGQAWAGDGYRRSLYTICPNETNTNPQTTARYSNTRGGVLASFNPMGYIAYCDQVGKETDSASVQVAKPHSRTFKQIGQTVVYNEGLNEILADNYVFPQRFIRDSVLIPSIGNLCTQGKKQHGEELLRVKLTRSFTPDHAQTFQHSLDGSSTNMGAGTSTFTSPTMVINCK